jgi:hypothetical protein
MSGVYNRKLFRQASARDELRKIGGIMASSEELMREAVMTAAQAPRPSDLGSMPLPPQPAMPQSPMGMPMQPMMQQPMDMGMQQPMMQQPMDMGMQQPMDMGMQQPMMGQPFMPPQVPQSAQAAPAPGVPGFFAGGLINLLPSMGGAPEADTDQPTSRPNPNRGIGIGPSTIDISKPAGSYQSEVGLSPSVVQKAEELATKVDEQSPEDTAQEILDTAAAEGGQEQTGDTQSDLAAIYASLTGDPAAYEKNIDALNRGIIGAAIGAGTSARATENISKGMLVGLEAARDTEERRVRDSRALQLAQLEAQAAASRKASDDNGSRAYRNPVDAYQDAYQSVMNAGEMDLEIPEGMSREDYADQVALDLIRRSYSPGQLVGSPFEGMSAPAATGAEGSTQTEEDVLNSARAALNAGADEAAVRERLQAMGIDPEKL